jgi:para-aminobenzoate synthetase component I
MPESAVPLRVRGAPLVETVPSWVEPPRALAAAARLGHPALLFSGQGDHPASLHSILAFDPLRILILRGHEAELIVRRGGAPRRIRLPSGDPFGTLRLHTPHAPVSAAPGLPFAGGAIGYLGYGLRRSIERLPEVRPDPLGAPDGWFALYDNAVLFDHAARRITLLAARLLQDGERESGDPSRRLDPARRLLERAAGAPAAGHVRGPSRSCRARAATPRAAYLRSIERALAYIGAGDLYQVNLSHRIDCPFDGDPVTLFGELAERNPAPFSAYLETGEVTIVSTSPERFLELRGGEVRSSPIKGTRPRGSGAEQDLRLARELTQSPKERAENVMITDLVRNDLGRVCEPGSVRVPVLCGLESFATVHHLVSTVAGRLRPDRDRIDLLRAMFPGGSMTGAPKVRAMEVIDELEGEERGIYSGGVGYLSLDGALDFNIVIRTILCGGGRASLRVGGGIVADSDPEAEYGETLAKGRALLQALRAEL